MLIKARDDARQKVTDTKQAKGSEERLRIARPDCSLARVSGFWRHAGVTLLWSRGKTSLRPKEWRFHILSSFA
jgi:hypothetical protein